VRRSTSLTLSVLRVSVTSTPLDSLGESRWVALKRSNTLSTAVALLARSSDVLPSRYSPRVVAPPSMGVMPVMGP
jgi:hypothetical protein